MTGDLISREALAEHFKGHISAAKNARDFRAADAWGGALWDVQDAPTVDAVPVVHGRWERMEEYCNHAKTFRCTACKSTVEYPHFTRFCEYDYCPDCGAKMDEEAVE